MQKNLRLGRFAAIGLLTFSLASCAIAVDTIIDAGRLLKGNDGVVYDEMSLVNRGDQVVSVNSRFPTVRDQKPGAQLQTAICQQTNDAITITIGDLPLLTYHKSIVHPPENIDPVFKRSGYVHPIKSPSGKEVTGDFAPDHAHQHAFFMAWVNTHLAGHDIDFWNQKKQTGRISHNKVVSVNNKASYAEFEVELTHEDTTLPKAPVLVLSERWKIRAYHRAASEPFVFDFESNQTCMADSPLILREYRYGGFGLRGNQQWHRPGANAAFKNWTTLLKNSERDANVEPPDPLGLDVMGHEFLTSENKQRHNGNHSRARWTTMYGPVEGAIAGIAILSHPKNFRSPQHVRLHPGKPYFSYAPVVAGEFKIEPKETYTTRFRVVSYDGLPDKKLLNRLWSEYSTKN